jgi:hypothetical protein
MLRHGRQINELTSAYIVGVLIAGAFFPGFVLAQAPSLLPPQTQLVATSEAPAATEETFTIATAEDLLVTFTDFQTPAALSTATILVTQGASIVGMTTLASPATTATLALPAAVGQYTLRVIGTPNASSGVGTFSVCVAPTATPAACIQDASLAGNITQQSGAANPTLSTLAMALTVTTAGAYTFTYADEKFPVALAAAPSLALFQGSQKIAAPVPASPAVLNLNRGTYTLFAVAQADPTAMAGLYGILISGPAGTVPLLNSSFPVGVMAPSMPVNNLTAQPVSLKVTDFAFPSALASAAAMVTAGATVVGKGSAAGGPTTLSAPAGALQVWTYGAAAATAGTYEVDLTVPSPSASLLQSALGVNGGGSFAYAFVTPNALVAGDYQATANDFAFPTAISAVQFAVAQNGAILAKASAFGPLDFTAAAAPLVVLIDATPPANGNGLVDVNVLTSGSSPQQVFDQVQPVSAAGGFTSRTINLGTSGSFDVTLADLKFPAAFQTLALVGSSNGALLGKIFGNGTFTITASPTDFQFSIVAIPATQAQYGLYGLSIVNTPPTATLTASSTTVAPNALTTLSWTTTNATACTASGGTFVGPEPVGSGSISVIVATTTTYTLTCTGPGGTVAPTVMVTAMAPASGSSGGGGGGAMGTALLAMLTALVLLQAGAMRSSVRRS